MASYHFSAQIISRAKGRSAVAAAAYRAGERLHDRQNDQSYDYSRRRGVAEQTIMLPDGAASWLADREQLWNHVEALERRRDAQLVREINLALPHELTHAARVELVREFVREQFVSRGMVADVAWHDPVPDKGDDPRNYHAHIMLTLRQAGPQGLYRVKTREWNSDTLMRDWREAWAHHQNRALERTRIQQRVDHRSLRAQREDARERGDRVATERLDRVPEIHIGPQARAAGRRMEHSLASHSRTRSTARSSNGNWCSSGVVSKRQRTIDYPIIDRGSRNAYGAERMNHNLRSSYARINKLERLDARLRARELRAARILTVAGLPANQQTRFGLVLTPRRIAIAQRHRSQIALLLRDIERILAGLKHSRTMLRQRQHALLRTRERSLGRDNGRHRDA